MLSIFVCEDQQPIRAQITECIEKYIMMEGLDMKMALSTDTPYGILGYLRENTVDGLYFLDVDLQSDINGITLAERIRGYDPRGFIVFITAHGDTLQLTFKYKVEALDFIVKNDKNLETRICECISSALTKYNTKAETNKDNDARFIFKRANGSLLSLFTSKILYFEASQAKSHRIIVYLEDSVYDFYGSLNDVERTIDEAFYRCHKSFIVNLRKITKIDDDKSMVHFENGLHCPVSTRKLSKIKSMIKKMSC